VTFYDVATGAAGASLPTASTVTEIGVGAIAWSRAGLVATASEDGYVRLWRAETRELVGELPGHDTTTPGTGARSLHGLAFSPNGDVLFVGGGPPGEHVLSAYLLA
jgi:WD40 repeat protein